MLSVVGDYSQFFLNTFSLLFLNYHQPLELRGKEETWQAVVLIPKGGGKYHGIGLMEVIWKAVAVILNHASPLPSPTTNTSTDSGRVTVQGPSI